MLNATVIALAAASASYSPFFALKGSLNVHHSIFSRHVASVVFGKPAIGFSASDTRFSTIIGTAVSLMNDGYYHKDETFHDAMNPEIGPGMKAIFNTCLFLNCGGANSDGGAIKMTVSGAELSVTQTGFTQCSASESAGGVYCVCDSVVMEQVCFDACRARKAAAMVCVTDSQATMTDSHVGNIVDQRDGAVLSVNAAKASVTRINSSNVMVVGATGVLDISGGVCFMESFEFKNCVTASVLCLDVGGELPVVRRMNCIDTRARNVLLRVDLDGYTFDHCAFVNDQSNRIIKKSAIFTECWFSVSEGDKSSVITGSVTFSACAWNNYKTIEIAISNSVACWQRMTMSETPTSDAPVPSATEEAEATTSVAKGICIAVGVIVGVSALAVALFFGYKYVTRRRIGDSGRSRSVYSVV